MAELSEYTQSRSSNTSEIASSLLNTVSKASVNKSIEPIKESRLVKGDMFAGQQISPDHYEDVITGYRIKTEETRYKEPFTSDVVSSYFIADDMKLERLFISTASTTKNFADRYKVDLSDAHNFIIDLANNVAITAKARDAFTARLAKTDVTINDTTQKQWIQDQRAGQEQKGGIFGFLTGGR